MKNMKTTPKRSSKILHNILRYNNDIMRYFLDILKLPLKLKAYQALNFLQLKKNKIKLTNNAVTHNRGQETDYLSKKCQSNYPKTSNLTD